MGLHSHESLMSGTELTLFDVWRYLLFEAGDADFCARIYLSDIEIMARWAWRDVAADGSTEPHFHLFCPREWTVEIDWANYDSDTDRWIDTTTDESYSTEECFDILTGSGCWDLEFEEFEKNMKQLRYETDHEQDDETGPCR